MGKCVLVTGANGQLGKSLRELATRQKLEDHFFYTDVAELDITQPDAVASFVKDNHIDVIVNVAAYTAVDKAEDEIEKAYLLNETAVENLAAAAAENNAFMIHISTDYVFDGHRNTPYPIDAQTNPVSVYGKSKLRGEQAMARCGCRGAIIRTAWLYSPFGNNFAKTMLRLADTHPEISVVSDQFGCPTLAGDLAAAILKIISSQADSHDLEIYHFANKGKISWYDFACEILRLAGRNCLIRPIATKDYPTKANRPTYSVFDLSKTEKQLQIAIPDWQESLKKAMPEIIYNYEHDIR